MVYALVDVPVAATLVPLAALGGVRQHAPSIG
jgi:hypothetical protein